MCGRYTLTSAPTKVAEHFDLPESAAAGLRPRWNVAPGQQVPVVTEVSGAREIRSVHWGFRGFEKRDATAPTPINARIETAARTEPFASAFFGSRCLVPADGFFEWRKRAGGPEPHWISLPDEVVFAFAGLTDLAWAGDDGTESMAIVTRPARGRLRELHDRMPVLIAPADYAAWLDPERLDAAGALAVCESPLSEQLGFRPVDARVNDVRFDDPACIAPSRQLAWF